MYRLRHILNGFTALCVTSVCLATSAVAQDSPVVGGAGAVETTSVVQAAEAPENAVRIIVAVEDVDDELRAHPAAGVDVKLSIIRPPHEVVETLHGTTNEEGEAEFFVPVAQGQQAFASAQMEGREVFSDAGVALDQAGETTIFVRDERETADTSTVFAPRVITIAELWEDYIVFTQIWTLATSAPVQVAPDSSTKKSGLEIPLPDEASGIRVIQPEEGVQVTDTSMYYQRPIQAAGTGSSSAPSVVVRFSIKHENASSLAWEQRLPFAVENASVVVPQSTQHTGFERLDVSLSVPICGESPSRDAMCFENIRTRAEGVPMLEGVAVQIAGGGRTQDLPSVMRVHTDGWPTPVPVATIVSALAGGVALLAIIFFVLVELRNRRQGDDGDATLAHLIGERDRRLAQAGRLRARLDRAELLESEYELEMARLREELAMIEQRIQARTRPERAGQQPDSTVGA